MLKYIDYLYWHVKGGDHTSRKSHKWIKVKQQLYFNLVTLQPITKKMDDWMILQGIDWLLYLFFYFKNVNLKNTHANRFQNRQVAMVFRQLFIIYLIFTYCLSLITVIFFLNILPWLTVTAVMRYAKNMKNNTPSTPNFLHISIFFTSPFQFVTFDMVLSYMLNFCTPCPHYFQICKFL